MNSNITSIFSHYLIAENRPGQLQQFFDSTEGKFSQHVSAQGNIYDIINH